jgi:hypothetical protein
LVSGDRVKELLRDLLKAILVVEIRQLKMRVMDGILDQVVESGVVLEGGGGKFESETGGRSLLKIVFGETWTIMLGIDYQVNYPLDLIVGMRHGLSQAVARHCLSNDDIHESLEGLMEKVGYEAEARSARGLRKAKRALAEDRETFNKLGVDITKLRMVHRG